MFFFPPAAGYFHVCVPLFGLRPTKKPPEKTTRLENHPKSQIPPQKKTTRKKANHPTKKPPESRKSLKNHPNGSGGSGGKPPE